jgi:hypothetical protein
VGKDKNKEFKELGQGKQRKTGRRRETRQRFKTRIKHRGHRDTEGTKIAGEAGGGKRKNVEFRMQNFEQ